MPADKDMIVVAAVDGPLLRSHDDLMAMLDLHCKVNKKHYSLGWYSGSYSLTVQTAAEFLEKGLPHASRYAKKLVLLVDGQVIVWEPFDFNDNAARNRSEIRKLVRQHGTRLTYVGYQRK